MPPGSPLDNAAGACAICDHAIEDAALTDCDTGRRVHPACAVDRLPHDAVVRLLGLLGLIVVPTIVVWAA